MLTSHKSLLLISLCVLFIVVFIGIFYFKNVTHSALDVHAAHRTLAEQAAQNQISSNIPGLQGDRNLRYSVSFIKPDIINPGEDVQLHFLVTDASNGNPVTLFRKLYEKPMHMIVVDNELKFFEHIHPTPQGNDFSITTNFPHPGLYRLYLTYQPWNAIEQQVAFTIRVGMNNEEKPHSANYQVDKNLTKQVGDYAVTFDTHGPLSAGSMSFGQQTISVTIRDTKTKKLLTNLKPYLGAFGHMTMIQQTDYSYLHIHPANLTTPKPDENGGPTIDFLPIGIYGKFSPGIYRVFAEFNPDNKLFTVDFTVKVAQ